MTLVLPVCATELVFAANGAAIARVPRGSGFAAIVQRAQPASGAAACQTLEMSSEDRMSECHAGREPIARLVSAGCANQARIMKSEQKIPLCERQHSCGLAGE